MVPNAASEGGATGVEAGKTASGAGNVAVESTGSARSSAEDPTVASLEVVEDGSPIQGSEGRGRPS